MIPLITPNNSIDSLKTHKSREYLSEWTVWEALPVLGKQYSMKFKRLKKSFQNRLLYLLKIPAHLVVI